MVDSGKDCGIGFHALAGMGAVLWEVTRPDSGVIIFLFAARGEYRNTTSYTVIGILIPLLSVHNATME